MLKTELSQSQVHDYWHTSFWDHINVMGPYLTQLYILTCQTSHIFKTESAWSKTYIYEVFILLNYVRAIFDHVKTRFSLASLYSEILKTNQYGLRNTSKDFPDFVFMFLLCWKYVAPSITSKSAGALKLSQLSRYCLQDLSYECLLFGFISAKCFDHV